MSLASPPGKILEFYSIRKEANSLVRLGLPVIGAQLTQVAMNFVDTVMAGNLSALALAAVAVGGSLWMAVSICIMGGMMAVTASVSQLFGAQKKAEVGKFVRQALWLSQVVALIAFGVVRHTDSILVWLKIDPAIIPITLSYIDAITWGLPALCAFIVFRYFSEGVSMTRPILFIGLIGLLTNIAGNYVFMYGKLGLPAMGAVGCGWASALVMWMMFACIIIYVRCHSYYRPFRVFECFDGPNIGEIKKIIKLGLPIGVSVFLEASLFSTVALLMGSLGTEIVAGHQIAINIASISFMVTLGLSIAITVRVGQAIGRGSQAEAMRAGFVGLALGLIFMGIAATCLLLLPELIVGVYTNDPTVTAIAVELLFMAAIFQLSDGAQVLGAGALRGLKDTAVPMLITLVAYWGIGLPLGYTLGVSRLLGPQAIWIGLIAGLTVAAICLNGRFYFVTRRMLATESSALKYGSSTAATK